MKQCNLNKTWTMMRNRKVAWNYITPLMFTWRNLHTYITWWWDFPFIYTLQLVIFSNHMAYLYLCTCFCYQGQRLYWCTKTSYMCRATLAHNIIGSRNMQQIAKLWNWCYTIKISYCRSRYSQMYITEHTW